MSLFSSDNKEHMTLQAYEDEKFSKSMGDEYEVLINPETFNKSMSVSYHKENAMTNSVSLGKFENMAAITYDFSIIIDGTGVVNAKRRDVKKEIDTLTNVLFKIYDNGLGYEPNYVAISYCGEIFHCQITSFKTEYQLFNTNGTPLRAKINCNFSSTGSKPTNQEEKETENKIDENMASRIERAKAGNKDSLLQKF